MASSVEDIVQALISSIENAQKNTQPYDHWFLSDCIPQDTLDEIIDLPIKAPDLGGESGRRELHNATRNYFDADNNTKYSSCGAFSVAFQDKRVTDAIGRVFGAKLDGTSLRIEYVQDTGGFWLEPHTDIGVKNFTMLIYLSKDPAHRGLGTDVYDSDQNWVGRAPFHSNAGLIFVPANDTYHGFKERNISGIRKSLIINYVTSDWRERDQLAYPDQPVAV